jgi:hypothetical protein
MSKSDEDFDTFIFNQSLDNHVSLLKKFTINNILWWAIRTIFNFICIALIDQINVFLFSIAVINRKVRVW